MQIKNRKLEKGKYKSGRQVAMFDVLHKEVKEKREFRTVDIVKRRLVITSEKVRLKVHPAAKPATIFNPSITIEDEKATLYARIILGYYTYSSAVAQISLSLSDIYSPSIKTYEAEIKVYPDCRYDYWGVEDPRVYKMDGKLLMTYCGRTVNYFNPAVRNERTLPVTAILDEGKWRKVWVFRIPEKLTSYVITDKNAFLMRRKKLLLFHRLHLTDEKFYLTVSKVPDDIDTREMKEIQVYDTSTVFEPAEFEQKIGWATPPIRVGKENLVLLHGVDREMQCYRVFAVLIDDSGRVRAVTPHYIMEPKEIYEIYGDRPHVVFPCGAQKIDDKILISYGATDSVVGIGEMDLSEVMSILDKNRL